MKKFISAIIVFTMILSCSFAFAAEKDTLQITTSNASVKVDETFTLTFTLADVYTYFLEGTYDSTKVTVEDFSVKGTDGENYKAVNICSDGKFLFMNTINKADSNDVIYTITFKAKAAGSFSLNFTKKQSMQTVENIHDTDITELKLENTTVTISGKAAGNTTPGGTGGGSTGSGSTGGGSTGGGSTGGGSTGGGFGGTTAPPASTQNPQEAFTDLENHIWAKDAIYKLKNQGIISGVSETEFAPANNIKRGDFILILARMLKLTNEYSDNFADVTENMYYYDAIGKAKAAGIATGDGINFMPENHITRQDLITLAYRAFLNAGYVNEAEDLSSLEQFNDKAEISDYAQKAMASMVSGGIIQGSDGNVNPKGNATRAEVAVMCARMAELMNK